ncbi:efflux RND transporter periplasmic adaptor subunit [Sphingobacterium sp. UBA6645]|uniref:efflux RND transporter periplasmic adaptor subunit n=1 Tax=Sphingobacterium sp. UBA6645 TaxID=1947511 RepID=UPI0025DFE034|nr:efflux RND transporter periplasmic adaptor subunit [Sphingobacterium sp. UBA6645]
MKFIESNYKALLMFFFVIMVSCNEQDNQQQQTIQQNPGDENVVKLTDAQLKNAPIETMTLSNQSISQILRLNGKIDVPPQNIQSVSAALGGYLKSTNLIAGMPVSKGEVIAIIENPEFIKLQQDYLTAKSKYQFAELDFNRQKTLNESKASSDKVMQLAKAEMDNQQIQMNAIAQSLRLVNINPAQVSAERITKSAPLYSSITGYVSKINVNIGKYVTASDVLFELVNPDRVYLNLSVFEKDLQKLTIGQRLSAFNNTEPEKRYEGTIQLISRNIDEQGMATVQCALVGNDKRLVPGSYMNAEIAVATSFEDAVPAESVVNFEGKNYLFVEESKQVYRLVPVEIGLEENGYVQVMNAAELAGKNIVIKNAYTLLMKLKNTEGEE